MMKFFLSTLIVGLSVALAVASPPRDVFDHADRIKGAVLEKRVAGQSFVNEQLEKRASPYLNGKSKSISMYPCLAMILYLRQVRVRGGWD